MNDELESEILVEVDELQLSDLFSLNDPTVDAVEQEILKQVSRPRYNLGGSGPPGRAD